jgi:dolichyl-phosphate beta-glucosyltransferase
MECEIIIPCYRESQRLPRFLEDLAPLVSASRVTGRITIVDDGSGEQEVSNLLKAVEPIMTQFPQAFRPPLLLADNLGKGGAVYAGWKSVAAHGAEYLGFIDADGSTNGTQFCKLVEHLDLNKEEVDGVLGSRVKMLGNPVGRSLKRHLMGRCFATLVSNMTGLEVYDSQCGAKVFKREVFLAVEPTLKETGFVFDVELILASLLKGYRLLELPVSWTDTPGSKVHLVRDTLQMFLGLSRIRRHLGSMPRAQTHERPGQIA